MTKAEKLAWTLSWGARLVEVVGGSSAAQVLYEASEDALAGDTSAKHAVQDARDFAAGFLERAIARVRWEVDAVINPNEIDAEAYAYQVTGAFVTSSLDDRIDAMLDAGRKAMRRIGTPVETQGISDTLEDLVRARVLLSIPEGLIRRAAEIAHSGPYTMIPNTVKEMALPAIERILTRIAVKLQPVIAAMYEESTAA